MDVLSVRSRGTVLAALEIRDDLSMVERRSSTMGSGLSLAVAPAGTEILLALRHVENVAAIVLLSHHEALPEVEGQALALGTARVETVDRDENGVWVRPIKPGVIQAGDVLRVIPAELLTRTGPFPRIPDGLPTARDNREERFSAPYEARAEALWHAIIDLGFRPVLEWAGSEDGEAIVARGQDGSALLVVDLEDPEQQAHIDEQRAAGQIAQWVCEEISALNPQTR